MLSIKNISFSGEHERLPEIKELAEKIISIANQNSLADNGEEYPEQSVLVIFDNTGNKAPDKPQSEWQTILVGHDYNSVVYPVLSVIDGEADSGVKLYSYGMNDIGADIATINEQEQELNNCFELLAGAFMGRVYVGKNEIYTTEIILIAASACIASGVCSIDVVAYLNSFLKR